MIAFRLGMLAVAAAAVLAALGAADGDLQPSARRLLVTSVVAVLAPLFWPGRGATPMRTAVRIVAWSFAAASIAACALLWTSHGTAIALIGKSCGVLFALLIVVHALAAALEAIVPSLTLRPGADFGLSGPLVALALVLFGALPVLLGPAAELMSAAHPWTVDALLAVSPLAHLAVAGGNDLLRNQWFYQHSNLAALQYDYPRIASFTAFYTAIGATLLLVPRAARGRGRSSDGAFPAQPTTDPAK